MKHKIAFIDENDGWLNTFHQSFKDEYEVSKVKVKAGDTVDKIVKNLNDDELLDAIVTDYLLEEEGEVSFNGEQIFDKLKEHRPHFPVIMLTAHEPEAINHMDDVHVIYDKSIFDGESETELNIFKAKVRSNIENYHGKFDDTMKKIEILVNKKNEKGLEPADEESLTKLFILWDELDPGGKEMPVNMIQPGAITKLNELVAQSREILETLKKLRKTDPMIAFRNQTPQRRKITREVGDHGEHRADLKKDYNDRCGYCDDIDTWRNIWFEIDHFVPKAFLNKIGVNDYANLVYACRSCNNAKRAKWPTQLEDIHHQNDEGFIDPCDVLYDKQFLRAANGRILPQTKLGQWMYKELKLYKPQHEIIWNIHVIDELIIELDELDAQQDNEAIKTQLNKCLRAFRDYMKELSKVGL